jgi:hypothetical protein
MAPSHIKVERVLVHQVLHEGDGYTFKPFSWVKLLEG